jgi:hypothetical protein
MTVCSRSIKRSAFMWTIPEVHRRFSVNELPTNSNVTI